MSQKQNETLHDVPVPIDYVVWAVQVITSRLRPYVGYAFHPMLQPYRVTSEAYDACCGDVQPQEPFQLYANDLNDYSKSADAILERLERWSAHSNFLILKLHESRSF